MSTGPVYWMYETSGVLREAVEAYLTHQPMTQEQIEDLRNYLRQWIDAPIWDQNPHAGQKDQLRLAGMRLACDGLVNREAIDLWIWRAMEQGLGPL